METIQKYLENHPLYGLDGAICAYLAPVLERELGESFRAYRQVREARFRQTLEETRALGKEAVGRHVRLQEELVVSGGFDPESNGAWHTLLNAAGEKWEALCLLYEYADAERHDLECMAAAQQTAEELGSRAYARRVGTIISLEEAQAPTWWAAE